MGDWTGNMTGTVVPVVAVPFPVVKVRKEPYKSTSWLMKTSFLIILDHKQPLEMPGCCSTGRKLEHFPNMYVTGDM